MNKHIWKTVIKISAIIIVFIMSIYFFNRLINKDSIEMTMEMGAAQFPLVYAQYGGNEINEMRGYQNAIDAGLLRETLTPLTSGRKLNLVIDKYGCNVSGLEFEVRSIDGERLIEKTEITEYEEKDGKIILDATLKDLIELNKEYLFALLVNTEQRGTIYYYTRVVQELDYHVGEKLDYILDFHMKTFDKEAAKDIVKYLESNSEGDNTTFSKVNIHSSFHQITWGDLHIQRDTAPRAIIRELNEQTGSFILDYQVSTSESGKKVHYQVEEYYRVRFTTDRMYLLDFERTMDQIFDKESNAISENKITLGITETNVQLMENDTGNAFAFEVGNGLYAFDITNNKLALVFSFYNAGNHDARYDFRGHQIKVLNIDEAGNVTFLVYGYMNRGKHEGDVGISVYHYNSMANTIEEMVYLPYDRSAQVLQAEVERLAYVNKMGELYLMLGQEIYAIQLEGRTYKTVVSGLSEGSIQVSDSNKMLVWQNDPNMNEATQLILLNLSTGKKTEINAGSGEYIKPLGFIGEDLIYGVAKISDIVTGQAGKSIFPMYSVKIENEVEGVLKEERHEGIYVIGGVIEQNQITLNRMIKTNEGSLETTDDGHIMSGKVEEAGKNYVETAATEQYAKLVQIVAKNSINMESLKYLTPKEVLFEGSREMHLQHEEMETEHYYVFGKNGIEGIFTRESNAVNLAYEISGVVIDAEGEYVWYRGNRSLKNQIMAIKGELVTETKNSMAICIETMLSYNGVIRNAEYMINRGESILSVLEDNMENVQILDLTGCSLDSVLYYVNKDIPVLVTLKDGNAMLLIGFNELNTVVMDPVTGTSYKMGMNDSKAFFEENGNYFITYYEKNE